MGLAAVTGIIRAHQGTISVDTALGMRDDIPGRACPRLPARRHRQRQFLQTELAGQGLILIADDEELVRTMARVTLERFGYTVVLATNGREAEDRFAERREEYAAVLLDLTMPVLHGEAVLRHIRALRSDVPVVLSSGYTESEALKRFEDLRLAGFLQKPYTATTLARKIKHAIRGVAA